MLKVITSLKLQQRMLLKVKNYNLCVKYKKGSDMVLADTLSRVYLEEEVHVQALEFESVDTTIGLAISPSRLKE